MNTTISIITISHLNCLSNTMFGGLTGTYEGFFKTKILSIFLSQNSQIFHDKIQEENQHKTTDNKTMSFFSVHIRKSNWPLPGLHRFLIRPHVSPEEQFKS